MVQCSDDARRGSLIGAGGEAFAKRLYESLISYHGFAAVLFVTAAPLAQAQSSADVAAKELELKQKELELKKAKVEEQKAQQLSVEKAKLDVEPAEAGTRKGPSGAGRTGDG